MKLAGLFGERSKHSFWVNRGNTTQSGMLEGELQCYPINLKKRAVGRDNSRNVRNRRFRQNMKIVYFLCREEIRVLRYRNKIFLMGLLNIRKNQWRQAPFLHGTQRGF